MNILFLNVGRRCELVQAFKKVMPKYGSGRIIATDIVETAPALALADKAILFPHSSKRGLFLKAFMQTCIDENVSLVIPSIDPDLVYLSEYREEIEKALPNLKICLSTTEAIRLCRDKRLSREKFAELGAKVPEAMDPEAKSLKFPMFLKPAGGSASQGIHKIENKADLERYFPEIDQPMLESYIEGPEYTVDVLCAFDEAKAYYAVPRKRLAVRGGEVSRGVVERDSKLEALAMKIAEGFDCRGPVTVQFRKEEDGTFVAMELNARVGGGLPLTIAAGADWPSWILSLAKGEVPSFDVAFEDALLMSRFDSSRFIKKRADREFSDVDLSEIDLVIFDMDDTLYAERDFVFSGYRAVAEKVYADHGIEIESLLKQAFEEGCRGDLFSKVFNQLGNPQEESYIKELVQIYRSHKPTIRPYLDCQYIQKLQDAGKKLALISDGWLEVQRNKFEALDLNDLFDEILFTDELGREFWKPNPKSFELICDRFQIDLGRAVYVADNAKKDFVAPNELGMKTVQVKRAQSEYAEVIVPNDDYKAQYAIETLTRLKVGE